MVVKSLLALVPKKKFNHIISFSLFTSLDKVIVEVLSQKFFQKHSRNIICVQAAFVKDRQILDVFLVANEILNKKLTSREAWLVSELDF